MFPAAPRPPQPPRPRVYTPLPGSVLTVGVTKDGRMVMLNNNNKWVEFTR